MNVLSVILAPIEGAKQADGVIFPVKRPWKGVLRITAIFDETPTVKTFRLMEPNLGTMPFTFLPGQYATITSEIDGQTASSPTPTRKLGSAAAKKAGRQKGLLRKYDTHAQDLPASHLAEVNIRVMRTIALRLSVTLTISSLFHRRQ